MRHIQSYQLNWCHFLILNFETEKGILELSLRIFLVSHFSLPTGKTYAIWRDHLQDYGSGIIILGYAYFQPEMIFVYTKGHFHDGTN